MKKLNRLIPAVVSLAVFILLQQLVDQPKNIFSITLLIFLAAAVSIWQLSGRKIFDKKFWQFIITPEILLMTGILFLSFLEGNIFKQAFIYAVVAANWIFYEVAYYWFFSRPKYQPHALENISTHINLISIFLLASSLFSLVIYFNLPPWGISLIFIAVSLLLTYQLVWASGSTISSAWIYILVVALVTFEIFYAVRFLPTSFYVSGMLVTIGYYFMSGLTRNYLLDIKDSTVMKRYAIISISALVIIVLTAKWF